MNKLSLLIKDYSFIHNVQIFLNKITVFYGMNGSGKSLVKQILDWIQSYDPLSSAVTVPTQLGAPCAQEGSVVFEDVKYKFEPVDNGTRMRISCESKPVLNTYPYIDIIQGYEAMSSNNNLVNIYPEKAVYEEYENPASKIVYYNKPENCCHPYNQSRIGYLIGDLASSGCRVLVETHSEHLINGLRRYIVSKKTPVQPEDLSIWYFDRPSALKEELFVQEITMDEQGNLSDMPDGFCDQVRKDLYEIIRMTTNEKEEL